MFSLHVLSYSGEMKSRVCFRSLVPMGKLHTVWAQDQPNPISGLYAKPTGRTSFTLAIMLDINKTKAKKWTPWGTKNLYSTVIIPICRISKTFMPHGRADFLLSFSAFKRHTIRTTCAYEVYKMSRLYLEVLCEDFFDIRNNYRDNTKDSPNQIL
jgi:hypothetical protein